MELRSVNYGWAIWWSIYICGCQSAPGSSRQRQRLLQDLFHIHGLFHLSSGYKQPIPDAN